MKQILSILTVALLLAGASAALADDTAVYGAGSVSVPPNVLIVFDTSGSMSTVDVPGDYYDPATTYTGSYTSATVYERTWNWWTHQYDYTSFASSIGDLNCTAASDPLSTDGQVSRVRIYNSSGGYTCGGSRRNLYTGNWLNYDASSGALRSRMDVAKEVITDLLNNNSTGINFGLMVFNGSDGGKLSPNGAVGTATSTLVTDVAALSPGGMTPLAESLAEAGIYMAGKTSWYNAGVTYTSPMQYRCQKNYIILMTDGEPTADDDGRLNTGAYVNSSGDVIGDYDHDTNSGRLDDISAYLYDNDLSTLGSVGDFEMQNVITFTIGFQTTQQLLQDTASNGGGDYFPANSISGLQAAFQNIIDKIAEVNAVFVSPVVPISRMNRVYAGNYLYIGFFKPQGSGRWLGNIKKYGINSTGSLIDANGALATLSNGQIKDNALSYWSTSADGAAVDSGGVGGKLLDRTSRDIYTYMGTNADLTNVANDFDTGNGAITPTIMGVATTSEKDAIITDLHGIGKTWMMGDVLHSEPALVQYDTNGDGVLNGSDETVIFAGTNGGLLHCFKDSDASEVWGFVPYEQLNKLKNLTDAVTDHDYFTDGVPVVYENGLSQKILMYGQRRGSNYYYALNVNDYTSPQWLYKIGPTALGAGSEVLGQSWGRPKVVKLATNASTYVDAFLLPGGYDTNQDLDVPATNDSVGRAAFSVAVNTGALSVFNFNASNFSSMTHSVVDLVGIDPDNDGITNRIYAPDLGGNVFAYEDDNKDGTWSGRKFFSAKASASDTVQRKIFYAPDITKTLDGEMLFFGTGDRADPEETSVVNRFYAVNNEWPSTYTTMNESNLYDVTDNPLYVGSAADRAQAANDLEAAQGWYIRLEHTGEKMINAPVVYGGVVYFTTYEPESSSAPSSNPCDTVGGRGTARLYAVDYLTGSAVNDYSTNIEYNDEGEVIEHTKSDRSKIIGTSIPSAPVIAIFEGGAKMYVGVEGGVTEEDPVATYNMNMYYWRQLLN